MTTEQLAKLPKWAQDEFKKLQGERDMAVRELNEWCDSQTPSKVSIDEMVCTGEQRGPSTKVRYVQTERVTFIHAGARLDVSVRDKGCIELQWGDPDRTLIDVALIPTSYMAAKLTTRENMR